MASKLGVYNAILTMHLGERKLASLSEDRAPRRRLDAWWDSAEGPTYCLAQGLWNFAMADIELTYSPSVTPAYGFRYAFDKPTDWVRTFMMSADETYSHELMEREDQGAYWFANVDTIYVRHVSKSVQWGMDLSLWPDNFTAYVQLHGASLLEKPTSGSGTERRNLRQEAKAQLIVARGTDAFDETTRFPPHGSWVRARHSGSGGSRDGGSSTTLLG